jgi:hypothetical protein
MADKNGNDDQCGVLHHGSIKELIFYIKNSLEVQL